MDRLYVLDMPALKNFEADGKIIEYVCDHFSKYNCDKVERTDDLAKYYSITNTVKIIPLSSVEHTREWLFHIYKVNMIPIEIPQVLRAYSPGYKTMSGDVLLTMGYDKDKYFIKRIDKMKSWNSNMHPYDNTIQPFINKNGVYAISELRKIYAEYRIFVYKDEILDCKRYSGNVLTFPNTATIQSMIHQYEKEKHPQAYTLDVAITEIGTIPLEIHPFVSCGLYGFQDIKLLDMWEKGLDWYIQKGEENE